jgi:hypothetical protein
MDAENCNVLPRKVIQQHVGNFVALKPARTIEQRVRAVASFLVSSATFNSRFTQNVRRFLGTCS